MKKLYFSFIKELRNIHFGALFEEIDSRLDRINIDTPVTKEVAKRIKFQNKELLKLRIGNPDTRLTKKMNEKLHLRTKYLASMRLQIKGKQITYIPEICKAADRLTLWLEGYKKDLYKPSATIQTNLVKAMIDDRNKIPEIQQCITLLDLDGLLDEIKTLTVQISKLTIQRSGENTYSKTFVDGLRDAAYSDLSMLIEAIKIDYNLSTDEEKKEELITLNNLINSVLRDMRRLLRLRRTKSKKKRAQKAAMQELFMTTHKPAPAQINIPMVNYNELRLCDKRKPTPKSSKKATSKTIHN